MMEDDEAVLAEYFDAIRAVPRLTPGQGIGLLDGARRGNHEAAERFIEGCLEVTALLALHLAPAWMTPLDAIQEANIVLMGLVDDSSVQSPVAVLTDKLVRHYGKFDNFYLARYKFAPWPSGEMLKRFTKGVRTVLLLASEEARLLNHSFTGTEHVLLGLIQEREGVAAKALKSFGLSLEAVRERVEEMVGGMDPATRDSRPFTPRAKKVLEQSSREAFRLGHEKIATEHLLLGLVGEGEGVAVQVLRSFGPGPERVRQQTLDLMSGDR
jgi:hypothetical protein